ncbi:MAG: hypothetical protein WCB15_27355, partial [Desulfobacterales bacterium]
MTGSPNLSKNRISDYLAPNTLFTENRWVNSLYRVLLSQTEKSLENEAAALAAYKKAIRLN